MNTQWHDLLATLNSPTPRYPLNPKFYPFPHSKRLILKSLETSDFYVIPSVILQLNNVIKKDGLVTDASSSVTVQVMASAANLEPVAMDVIQSGLVQLVSTVRMLVIRSIGNVSEFNISEVRTDFDQSWLTDNNDTTCNTNGNLSHITVTLETHHPLTWVRVVVSDTGRLCHLFDDTQSAYAVPGPIRGDEKIYTAGSVTKAIENGRTGVHNERTKRHHGDIHFHHGRSALTPKLKPQPLSKLHQLCKTHLTLQQAK
ncbi:hypothetical protein PoB_004232700 [Plakobranchus ocellatus]|uniref:Uncharacterized protein n=1 Tax=Plakobranchus ocellatus TaxID=259542 RepID=A0AAV4B9F6_9GAST|nr:hypothetical protein PoB_004232700 [Plakobranchus ocellatus]